MLQFWSQMQQQLWQGWSQMGNSSQGSATPNLMAAMMDAWQQTTMQTARTMTENAAPTVKIVREQMMHSQTALLRLLEMTNQVWQNLQPVAGESDDWDAALQQQMEHVRNVLLQSATDVVGAGGNMTELWQTYLQQWQNFGMPWLQAAQNAMPMMGTAMGGDTQALTDMTGLYWDAFQQTFGQLLQAPGIGYTREFDEKQRAAFAAWLDYQQASYEYQVVLADTWVKAFEQLMQEMLKMQQSGEEIKGLRDFINRWSTIADTIFKDIFRSDAYVEVQSRLVNALMAYRVKQRSVNEEVLELLDMPTRSEIDEAHRRIYELRREVKALKREMAQLKEKPKSTRKSSSSRKKSSTTPKSSEET